MRILMCLLAFAVLGAFALIGCEPQGGAAKAPEAPKMPTGKLTPAKDIPSDVAPMWRSSLPRRISRPTSRRCGRSRPFGRQETQSIRRSTWITTARGSTSPTSSRRNCSRRIQRRSSSRFKGYTARWRDSLCFPVGCTVKPVGLTVPLHAEEPAGNQGQLPVFA